MSMTGTEQEVFERGEATLAAATTLKNGASAYESSELTIAGFGAKMQAARAARANESAKKAIFDAQRGLVNQLFDQLDGFKTQGIGMAKYRFRKDAGLLEMINSVGEYGGAREDTLREADEWSAAWQNIAPEWSPTPQNTRAAFDALRADCQAQAEILTQRKSDYRKAGIDLGALLAEIEDLYIAWYGETSRAFPIGTTEGDLIRSQIPTFDTSAAPKTLPQPTPNPV